MSYYNETKDMTHEQFEQFLADEEAERHANWLAQFTDGFYVNTYEVDRAWGGPEEGGWWFNTGRLVTSTRLVCIEDAEIIAEQRRIEYPRTDGSNSVVYAGGDYSTGIEAEPGADYPTERPHYE